MIRFCHIAIFIVLAAYPSSALALDKPLPGKQSAGQQESLLPEDSAPETNVIKIDDVVHAEEVVLPEDSVYETYGPAGGYIHPYITLAGEYTDNLFNVSTDEKTNLLTRISPGIWLSLPRTKEVPITITPHNTAAGGLQYEMEEYAKDEFNRFNAYLLGGLDFEFYSENSDLNTTTGKLEGLLRYNMKYGLSFQILDRYSRDNDRFDIGNDEERSSQRTHHSNLLGLTADWEISERLRAKINYGNFYLDYDEIDDAFLNRNDNAIGLYGYLNFTEKHSFFINYDYVDVAYDVDFNQKDNEQHFIYVGWDWVSTEKTDLLVKLGYQKKECAESSICPDNPEEFAFELQGEHDFTEKTKLITIISRKMEETDSAVASGKTVFAFLLKLEHEFSERIAGMIDFKYEKADYDQIVSTLREDDEFFIRPAVQYTFNDWFMAELAYSYNKRDSTDDQFDFDTNTVYLSLNFAR